MMKVRLTNEEVITACAEYAAKKTNFNASEESIVDSQYFIIKDADGKELDYDVVEFEFDAG